MHQHHCIALSTLAGPDSTRLQHFPQVVLNHLNQWQGNPSKSFLKGSVIHNFYHVFPWNGYSPILLDPMRTHCGIWPEPAGSIYQLWGPGIQATQVQFIKQFTMSMPNGQSGGMGILGLISPLQQLHFFRGFRHRQHCYYPGHQGFLLEGL